MLTAASNGLRKVLKNHPLYGVSFLSNFLAIMDQRVHRGTRGFPTPTGSGGKIPRPEGLRRAGSLQPRSFRDRDYQWKEIVVLSPSRSPCQHRRICEECSTGTSGISVAWMNKWCRHGCHLRFFAETGTTHSRTRGLTWKGRDRDIRVQPAQGASPR